MVTVCECVIFSYLPILPHAVPKTKLETIATSSLHNDWSECYQYGSLLITIAEASLPNYKTNLAHSSRNVLHITSPEVAVSCKAAHQYKTPQKLKKVQLQCLSDNIHGIKSRDKLLVTSRFITVVRIQHSLPALLAGAPARPGSTAITKDFQC